MLTNKQQIRLLVVSIIVALISVLYLLHKTNAIKL